MCVCVVLAFNDISVNCSIWLNRWWISTIHYAAYSTINKLNSTSFNDPNRRSIVDSLSFDMVKIWKKKKIEIKYCLLLSSLKLYIFHFVITKKHLALHLLSTIIYYINTHTQKYRPYGEHFCVCEFNKFFFNFIPFIIQMNLKKNYLLLFLSVCVRVFAFIIYVSNEKFNDQNFFFQKKKKKFFNYKIQKYWIGKDDMAEFKSKWYLDISTTITWFVLEGSLIGSLTCHIHTHTRRNDVFFYFHHNNMSLTDRHLSYALCIVAGHFFKFSLFPWYTMCQFWIIEYWYMMIMVTSHLDLMFWLTLSCCSYIL